MAASDLRSRDADEPGETPAAPPAHEHGGRRARSPRRGAHFLAEASAVLASSLDYEATLQQVAQLAVPALGDWCTVYMLADDGEVRRVAVAYVNGEKGELAAALRRYPPSPVAPRSSVAEVMRTGQPILTRRIPPQYVESIAQDADHLEIMRRLDFRSSMTVPLGARGQVFGALAFFTADPSRPYTRTDLELAEDLARRAGLAVDNARLYREAQRAIQVREEFLSVAAHELKTPLTSLLGYTQVLLQQFVADRQPDPAIVRRALTAIESQSERLARRIDRLLDVARIESGHLEIQPALVDVTRLVESALASAQVSAPRHTFVLRARRGILARLDALRFEQVLTNLLDNAAKFSPAGSQVEVAVELTDEPAASAGPSRPGRPTIRLTVTDHGVGIAPEHRARIFERFYQARQPGPVAGLGLGLYICRQIVQLHGGTITAEHPAEGGTRFVVRLPAAPAARNTNLRTDS